MSAASKNRQLPEKEAKLFKTLLTQYELKQYKKGVKAADTILKKFPNHGETLAIKALTIHSSLPTPATISSKPKEEEAEAMARLAVKKDISSHITWHVLGILAKSRKEWDEASRAFAMARKLDSDNIPLIRDAISLSLHTRQYNQALAARHHYLLLRPQIRSSWLGLVISHQLCGDVEEALKVYDGYMSTIKTDGASQSEKNQIMLHVVKMCIDLGRYGEALERLEKGLREGDVSPRGESTQLKAELLAKLGRRDEAEDTYRALLEQNSDNLEYYRGFLRTKGLDIDSNLDNEAISKVLKALQAFSESYPRSAAPRRLALDISRGEEFKDLVKSYIINGLERGVPSLFVDVKGVYTDPGKMAVVGEIVEEIIQQLEKDAGLHDEDTIPPPTTLLWAYYYLALHLSYPLHPNPSHQRSLDLLDLALKHTPTLPEIYMARAMVLKRAGDPQAAAASMEEARLLDGQDRFLNGKAGKYWLRAGEVEKAEEILALFTKKDTPLVADLTDLQCIWYLQEEGDAYRRNGNFAMALKRYQTVATVFSDYEDDQYDFHTYCLRRMTLSTYMALMRYEDQLRSHPAYFKAAIAAIEIYLKIHDDPSMTEEKLSPEEEAERKKAAKKAQKAETKAKKAALTTSDGKKEEAPIPDQDPNGLTLFKTETPLEDALKLWKPLEKLASERVEVWIKGYEINIRKKLYLVALKCLLAAHDIESDNPDLHHQILNFRRIIFESKNELPAPVSATIDTSFITLLPKETSSESYSESYNSKHPSSPTHILGYIQGLLEINPSSPSSPCTKTITSLGQALSKLTELDVPPSIPIFQSALEILENSGADKSVVEEFRKKCRDRLPLAWVLASPADKLEREKERALENGVVGDGKTDV